MRKILFILGIIITFTSRSQIEVGSPFNVKSHELLDYKGSIATLADTTTILESAGQITYVIDEGKFYYYNGNKWQLYQESQWADENNGIYYGNNIRVGDTMFLYRSSVDSVYWTVKNDTAYWHSTYYTKYESPGQSSLTEDDWTVKGRWDMQDSVVVGTGTAQQRLTVHGAIDLEGTSNATEGTIMFDKAIKKFMVFDGKKFDTLNPSYNYNNIIKLSSIVDTTQPCGTDQTTDIERALTTFKEVYVDAECYYINSTLTIPANRTLHFADDGMFEGTGTIVGNNTQIDAGLNQIFGDNITLTGTWNVKESYPEWLGGDSTKQDISNIIERCFNFNSPVRLTGHKYHIIDTINMIRNAIVTANQNTIIEIDSTRDVFYIHDTPCTIDGGTYKVENENWSGWFVNIEPDSAGTEDREYRIPIRITDVNFRNYQHSTALTLEGKGNGIRAYQDGSLYAYNYWTVIDNVYISDVDSAIYLYTGTGGMINGWNCSNITLDRFNRGIILGGRSSANNFTNIQFQPSKNVENYVDISWAYNYIQGDFMDMNIIDGLGRADSAIIFRADAQMNTVFPQQSVVISNYLDYYTTDYHTGNWNFVYSGERLNKYEWRDDIKTNGFALKYDNSFSGGLMMGNSAYGRAGIVSNTSLFVPFQYWTNKPNGFSIITPDPTFEIRDYGSGGGSLIELSTHSLADYSRIQFTVISDTSRWDKAEINYSLLNGYFNINSKNGTNINGELHIRDAVFTDIVTKTTNYTATADDNTLLFDCSSGDLVLTLPDASTVTGIEYYIKMTANGGSYKLTVTPAAGNIDNSASYDITAVNEHIIVKSDGNNYWIF